MRILFYLFTVLIMASGCGIQGGNNEAEGNSPTLTETQHTGEVPSDEEMLIGARNQFPSAAENMNSEKRFYSQEEAKLLVKKHLQLNNAESITFEGFKDDHYLFHVYDLVHFNNQPEKMTRGWYKVDPESGKVSLEKK
ncbi:MAG: hypothetical protein ACQEV7_22275 [Bacillota bacterium]